MHRATLAAATLAVATMLGQAHAWAESARDGIEAADRAFEAAFAKGDAASVAQLYTVDGALLPPGAARVDGRAGIERYWKDAIDAGFKSIALQVEEVTDAGDLAVEVGRWRRAYRHPSSTPRLEHGGQKGVAVDGERLAARVRLRPVDRRRVLVVVLG
jgi:ketosteroid isomerase-like protein